MLISRFLGGSFLNYGVDYVEWLMTDAENRNDPMYKVFPRSDLKRPKTTSAQFRYLCSFTLVVTAPVST